MKSLTLKSSNQVSRLSFALALVILITGVGLIGCAAKTTSIGLAPEELGRIGAQIQNNPEQTRQILARYRLTEAEFERAVREVSSHPAMARRYRKVFERNLEQ